MYYIAINNEQKGPYTKLELAAQDLTADTLVWKEGMPEWTALKNVAELASLAPTPPPPPTATPPPPPVVEVSPPAVPAPQAAVTPPPVQASAPPPPARPSTGSTLETGSAADGPNILDSEMANAAKETFSNMKLSTDGVMDFKSTTFNANRATIYALAAFVPFLLGSFFSPTFGFGALIMLLLFVVLPVAAGGLTWLEMKKLLNANGGPAAANFFKLAGFVLLGVAAILLLLSLMLGFSNPFSLMTNFGTIRNLLYLAMLGMVAVAVFHVLAGMKVMNYKAKYFKEFSYALFAGTPVAILMFYLSFNASGGGLLRIIGSIAYVLPLIMAIMIFQRAGKNNNQVS